VPNLIPMSETQELEKTLWATADKLRNNMDAAEYKACCPRLDFPEIYFDAFESIIPAFEDEIGKEWDKSYKDVKDICLSERVFYVPPSSRWSYLQGRANFLLSAKTLTKQWTAIEKDNPA